MDLFAGIQMFKKPALAPPPEKVKPQVETAPEKCDAEAPKFEASKAYGLYDPKKAPAAAASTAPSAGSAMPTVGDGGASWKLRALKRAQERAAMSGESLTAIVHNQYGTSVLSLVEGSKGAKLPQYHAGRGNRGKGDGKGMGKGNDPGERGDRRLGDEVRGGGLRLGKGSSDADVLKRFRAKVETGMSRSMGDGFDDDRGHRGFRDDDRPRKRDRDGGSDDDRGGSRKGGPGGRDKRWDRDLGREEASGNALKDTARENALRAKLLEWSQPKPALPSQPAAPAPLSAPPPAAPGPPPPPPATHAPSPAAPAAGNAGAAAALRAKLTKGRTAAPAAAGFNGNAGAAAALRAQLTAGAGPIKGPLPLPPPPPPPSSSSSSSLLSSSARPAGGPAGRQTKGRTKASADSSDSDGKSVDEASDEDGSDAGSDVDGAEVVAPFDAQGRRLRMLLEGAGAEARKEDLKTGRWKGKTRGEGAAARAEEDLSVKELAALEREGLGQDMDESFARNVVRLRGHYKGIEQSKGGSRAGFDEEDAVDTKMYEDRASRMTAAKLAEQQRVTAVREHKRHAGILSSSPWSVENPRFAHHLVAASKEHMHLLLVPKPRSLHPLHCVVVALRQSPSMRAVGEEVWAEGQAFKAALRRMCGAQGLGCIFLESAEVKGSRAWARFECVPLELEHEEDAPLYFRQALSSADDEWATHRACIDLKPPNTVRRALPPGFPYFAAEWSRGGVAHVIEDADRFDADAFGLGVVAGMVGAPALRTGTSGGGSGGAGCDSEARSAVALAEAFKPFDWP